MADVVAMLKEEEKALEKRLYALQSAIEALEGGVKKTTKPGRGKMSAATRRPGIRSKRAFTLNCV